jgi:hypothetical protein
MTFIFFEMTLKTNFNGLFFGAGLGLLLEILL